MEGFSTLLRCTLCGFTWSRGYLAIAPGPVELIIPDDSSLQVERRDGSIKTEGYGALVHFKRNHGRSDTANPADFPPRIRCDRVEIIHSGTRVRQQLLGAIRIRREELSDFGTAGSWMTPVTIDAD